MAKVRMVKARIELQFYPSGSSYPSAQDGEEAEQEKLAAVLVACDKLSKVFEKLLPRKGRTWWKQGGLQFEAVDGKVSTEEILKKINAKLKAHSLTHKQLDALRADLPEGFVSTNDFSAFPPAEEAEADEDEMALNFGVAPATAGVAAYYSPPEGPVFCCRTVSLTSNESPLQVMEASETSGQLDVLLIAHFDPNS